MGMRVIAWSTVQEFLDAGNDRAEDAFRLWFRKAEKADWTNLRDVRQDFPSADQVDDFLIFDVMGNSYRIITWVSYPHRRLLIKFVGNHRDYDKLKTKKDFKNL